MISLTLGKNKQAIPDYSVRPTGPKHRQRFLCELRVPGTFDYVGAGNSTNKKGKLKFFKSSSQADVYIAILQQTPKPTLPKTSSRFLSDKVRNIHSITTKYIL